MVGFRDTQTVMMSSESLKANLTSKVRQNRFIRVTSTKLLATGLSNLKYSAITRTSFRAEAQFDSHSRNDDESNRITPNHQRTPLVTMQLARTQITRTALRPTLRQATRLQRAQRRLAGTEQAPQGSVGDKGTAKVYNKDGTDPNKNLV